MITEDGKLSARIDREKNSLRMKVMKEGDRLRILEMTSE
jgi:hypothetical protein